MLLFEPPRAHAELDPALGDVVDGHHHLRQVRGVAERHRGDHRAEADPIGHGRERRDRRPWVERAALRAPGEREVVIRAEESFEAVLLTRACEGDPLIPRHTLLALDHQADVHVVSPVLDQDVSAVSRCMSSRSVPYSPRYTP